MEFPELGTHCAVSSCARLDFLPFECDSCHKIFCKEHSLYELHNCTEAYVKDVRVPVCPLCNQPVPVNRGEDPNNKVDEHIQKDCQSDKAKKSITNRCSYPGCKKRELVPVTCNTCRKNFCLKHRFETDHDCQGSPNRLGGGTRGKRGGTGKSATNTKPQVTTLSQIGAELNRERLQRRQQQQQQRPRQQAHHATPTTQSVKQPQNLSEDEALALALSASMNDTPSSSSHPPPSSSQSHPTPTSYEDDEALARAIAASLNDEQPKPKPKRTTATNQNSRSRSQSKDDCTIS